VPGGAASYHVAPPLWLLPAGAAAPEPDPEDPDPDRGAGRVVAVVAFGAARNVVDVRRGTVVVVTRRAVVVGTADTAVVDVAGGTVVVGPAGAGVDGAMASSTGCAGATDATASSPVATWGGDADGGADACMSANAGAPAIAAHSATGTAKRAFLDPRVVRTPPLLENAGAACPPPHMLKLTQRRFSRTGGEPTRALLWIANWANRTTRTGLEQPEDALRICPGGALDLVH
jgi:hypothetical protein